MIRVYYILMLSLIVAGLVKIVLPAMGQVQALLQ